MEKLILSRKILGKNARGRQKKHWCGEFRKWVTNINKSNPEKEIYVDSLS